MLNYILRRLGYGFIILMGVNLITFVLFFTVNTPDDMARATFAALKYPLLKIKLGADGDPARIAAARPPPLDPGT